MHFAQKNLILRCIPFMEKGVGSAWGLPVIAAGKERLSALSLSENLEAPGLVSFGADPFRVEHLREMESLGIGALGRYLGGEPIKPLRLGPEDFFCSQIKVPQLGEKAEKTLPASAAELFCTDLEFDNTYWAAEAAAPRFFRAHLEFLRTWGFSGGIGIDEAAAAPLLADYLLYLQKETERQKAKIIVLIAKQFFETRLSAQLPNAKVSAETAAGEIPVNFGAGNIPVLSRETSGLGIALYEDTVPLLRTQKTRCDILVAVNTGSQKNRESAYSEEIAASLKLTVSTSLFKHQNSAGNKNEIRRYLFRNCADPPLPFPFNRKTEYGIMAAWRPLLKRPLPFRKQENSVSREEAAALELLAQWEAGRVTKAGGCLFAVNAKFSGLRAADFKEEQALFLSQIEGGGEKKSQKNRTPPPIKPTCRAGVSFAALNQTQLEFFIRWRSECRRGYIHIMPDSMYIESYITLYAEELALCMGKEGPLQHFSALLNLFRACAGHYPETALRLCRYLTDFAVMYEIGGEAFPILLNALLNNNWFNETHDEIAGTKDLLADLTISFFLTEPKTEIETRKYWPVIKTLIPPRVLERKGNDPDLPSRFCSTLGMLDTQLRRDWNKSFFGLFFPPLLQKFNYNAFENGRFLGDSSYTILRPVFSSHKPLIDILTALTLEPEKNPLPGVKVRLYQITLENELLEELRKESDAVRDMLKQEDELFAGQTSAGFTTNQPGYRRQRTPEHSLIEHTLNERCPDGLRGITREYQKPDKESIAEFIASLDETKREAVFYLAGLRNSRQKNPHTGIPVSAIPASIPASVIDEINGAFHEQFGDLLIKTDPEGPSISAEYEAILDEWE